MGRAKHRVSIIIPNYNGKESLKRLLPSVADQTYKDYEVIIVDDFSADRSVLEYIKTFIKDHENMRLLENRENLGFVKTCNRGFGLAKGDYICLLTNDTEVTSNFLQRNVEIMDADSSIGILSCVIVDKDGDNWFFGGLFRAGLRVNLKDDFQGVRSVDWVAGTAPFYRRDVFDRVGLLDERYVMYHEDIDFCLRVRNETDYKLCMFPEKLVTHYVEPLGLRLPHLAKPDTLYYLGLKRRLGEAVQIKPDRIHYYGHRNHMLLLRRYCPKYIPKILLFNLAEIIRLPIVAMLRMKPKSFLFSIHLVVLTVRGTLEGLMERQSA